MAKRPRPSEPIKIAIAERFNGGEDAADLAKQFGVAESTVKDYASKFGKKTKRKVRRKVSMPVENTSVSSDKMLVAENKGLREEVQRLKNMLLEEILKHRGE